MEKGVFKTWTPGQELEFEERIKHCQTFAERHLLMLLRDTLKYDARSKEGKRAMSKARLRLATATNEDLEELAELQVGQVAESPGEIPGLHRASLVAKNLGHLKKMRTEIREKGIKRSELECR